MDRVVELQSLSLPIYVNGLLLINQKKSHLKFFESDPFFVTGLAFRDGLQVRRST